MEPNRVPRTPLIAKVLAAVGASCRPRTPGWEAILAERLWDEFYARSADGGPDSLQAQVQALWARLLAMEEDTPERHTGGDDDFRTPSPIGVARLNRVLGHVAAVCDPHREGWADLLDGYLRPILFSEGPLLDEGGGPIASLLEPLALRLTREELARSPSPEAHPDWRWDRGRR